MYIRLLKFKYGMMPLVLETEVYLSVIIILQLLCYIVKPNIIKH